MVNRRLCLCAQLGHRKGVRRALYNSLLKILRLQGYYNAFAGITLPNEKSVGLHESMGFRPVAVYKSVGYKLGDWHDVGWWQLALRQTTTPPTELVKLSDIVGTEEFTRAIQSGLAARNFAVKS